MVEAEASAVQAMGNAATAKDAATAVLASAPAKAAEVQRRVRKLGGRLAKQTQKVSAGLVEKAKDLGQNIQARSATGPQGEATAEEVAPGAEVSDGDDIFEIGSEDEEGLSDPEGETSEVEQPRSREPEHGILEL